MTQPIVVRNTGEVLKAWDSKSAPTRWSLETIRQLPLPTSTRHIGCACSRPAHRARPDRGHPARAPTPRPEDTDVRLLRHEPGPGRGPGHYAVTQGRHHGEARPSAPKSPTPTREGHVRQGRAKRTSWSTPTPTTRLRVTCTAVPAPIAPSSSPCNTGPADAGLGGASEELVFSPPLA